MACKRSSVRLRYSPQSLTITVRFFCFMTYFVYILYSEITGKYYVGQTENIENRLQIHNSGRNLSTKAGLPWILKYTEEFPTRTEAANREIEIKKKKSRKYIEWLISSAG